jgi:flavin reductase (DIM6/NTAB) family NADH-FMN oxidoreductase RutF
VISAAEFRHALSQFASGVTVVTTRDAEARPMGLTVSSFCSASLDPPLVLVCVDHRSDAHAGFTTSQVFGVSVLAEGQEDWSRRFSGGGPSKFEGITVETGRYGVAFVPGAVAQLECRIVSAHEAGDHVIYVGEVLSAHVTPGRPLLYHASGYRSLHQGGKP